MRVFAAFSLFLIVLSSLAQTNSNIPIGVWRTHLPSNSASTIALANNKLYVSSSRSSFTYDIGDNNLTPFSKIDGLSEHEISVIRFNKDENIGMIGYESGNIDIIKNGKLTKFDVIFRSTIAGSKKINNITVYKTKAFISCDYGVTVIDLKRNEVIESWLNLRVGAMPNIVYGCTLNANQDSVFLATQYGVMSAPYDRPGINLMDFVNWKVYTNISTSLCRSIGELNGRIYAGISNIGVFVLNGNTWQNIGLTFDASSTCWNLINSNNRLLVCANNNMYIIENPAVYTQVFNTNTYASLQDAIYDNAGDLWLADMDKGLIRKRGSDFVTYELNGPYRTSTFNLYYYKNNILANSGGYNNVYNYTYNSSGMYEFQDQDKWRNYSGLNSNYPYDFLDNVTAAYNPFDDTLYVGSFGRGFISFKKPNGFAKHDSTDTPLKTNSVTGMDVDSKGNLWISSYIFQGAISDPSLLSKSKTNVWTSYSLSPYSSKNEHLFLLDVRIDSLGNKWLRYGSNGMDKGVIVYNEKTHQQRYFTPSSTEGNLPSNRINCLEIDQKGVIWVGSDQGLSAFYDPSRAFTGSFSAPIYNGFGVLFDKNVTCIKTDGGNRKWVGTTEGLWLFNDNFTEALAFYTVDNSPLYSNYIIDIDIQAVTGEVFIATDKGIISYRSDATASNKDFSGAKIFPNPVRPEYNGVITIEGLKDNVMVKITDMQGKLFYETKSNGGTATWNMINYAGIKAETGMYLVFATTDKGEEKFVGKIAIVQ